MATKPYDQAFKFLAEQDPESLLLMLGAIEPDENAVIELLPREISAAAVLPDQPYLVTSARGKRVVHVEAWTRWEKEIPDRMVEYGPLHWFKYLLPVDSYVILLTKKGLPRRPPRSGVINAGGTRIETRFHLIRVWKIPARKALESGRPALLPFVPLMDGGREELEAGAEALRSVPDERQRSEMGLHFVMLGGLRYNDIDLLKLLVGGTSMMPIERLRESSFYQSILREGREEGREEGALLVLLRLLNRRFGPPGKQLQKRIQRLSLTQLEQLSEAILDFHSRRELSNWLRQHGA